MLFGCLVSDMDISAVCGLLQHVANQNSFQARDEAKKKNWNGAKNAPEEMIWR